MVVKVRLYLTDLIVVKFDGTKKKLLFYSDFYNNILRIKTIIKDISIIFELDTAHLRKCASLISLLCNKTFFILKLYYFKY